MVVRCSAGITGGVMRCLAYIGLSLLGINAAAAGELGSATLRGSRAYEAAPSYQVFPPAPTAYPVAPAVAIAQPVAAVSPYSFEIGARYWYSTGKLAKDLYDDPRSSE